MKKTQSLKLMLLGLLALGSTSTFAKVGDVFDDQDSGLMFEELANKKARLVGVTNITPTVYTIPTTVKNAYDRDKQNNPKVLTVTEVADNWFAAGELWFVKNGVKTGETIICPSLLDVTKPITLTIDAADLKTISTKALQPLSKVIKKFVVTANAGLTAIPDYAFFYADATFTSNPVEVARAEAALDKLDKESDNFEFDPISPTRTYCGEKDGKNVYSLTIAGNTDYIIFGEKVNPVALGFPESVWDLDWYEAISVQTFERVGYLRNSVDPQYGPRFAATALATPNAGSGPYPNLVEFIDEDDCLTFTGLKTVYAQRQSALQSAQSNLDQAKHADDYVGEDGVKTKADAAAKALAEAEALKKLADDNEVGDLFYGATDEAVAAIAILNPAGLTLQSDIDIYNNIVNKLSNIEGWPRNASNGFDIYSSTTQNSKINSLKAANTTAQNALALYEAGNIAPLEAALADAQAAFNRADAAMTEANAALENAIAKAQKDLEDAQLGAFSWQNAEDNTVLTTVSLLGEKIETIGKSAFESCVKAGFGPSYGGPESRIPVNTKTIAARAFYNASKINPTFDNVTTLESIGDEAFAKTGATTAVFTSATGLKEFGEDVFGECKLKNLLLAGTAIEKYPIVLAQNLFLETPKFVDDCGFFYNYDVTKEEDVTALKAAWKAKFNRDMTAEDILNMDKGELLVNTTLKTASLPEAIKAIPDSAFTNDIALATLEGGIPVPVETIGIRAFFRTKIKEFDLTDNINLTSVGSQAFAGNSELTKVILPQDKKDASGNVIAEAKMKTLGAGVFECDGDLEEVVLSPDITCLPAGTFAGNNKIATLDLSNTQIEVLYNLFGTDEEYKKNKYGEDFKEEIVNTSLTKIILPEQKIDETDNKTVLIPGLKIIDEYALAYMQGLTDVTIPSSVFWMGDGVFYNDINLKTVTAMDSRLVTIGFNTFRNCRKLETFTFVTLNVVDPSGDTLEDVVLEDLIEAEEITNVCDLRSLPELEPFFDDHNFFMTNATTLIMTKESIKALQDAFPTEIGFTNFQVWQPVLLTHTDGTLPYYNENYATWIKMDQADVYTCYQDVVDQVVKIYMVKAKHNQGFYKIPAAKTIDLGDGTYSGTINWRPDNSVYTFPGYNDTFMDWYIDGPAQDFSSEAPYYLYTPSAAVIIVEKANGGADGIKGQVPYERHSAANLINQSTLDPGNQMKITRTPLDKLSSSSNIMWYAHAGTEPNMWHGPITSGVIPAGKLVLPLSAGQANGNDPGLFVPSRIEVIWLDDDLTGINDVKDYIKSLRDSDAIYNLQGVKVTAPVKGQMYIQGGKKFIQK